MTTTANYILKAVVDGEVFIFQYDEAPEVWDALEQFWHGGDYAEHIARLSGSGEFPIDVIAMDGNKAIRKYEFMFNCAIFDHFFDKGWSASSTEPGQRYTLDQFAKDIERKSDKPSPKQLTAIMDRWAGFCYNHQPYEDVILWMVGGSKQHYLYQHFCSKFSHLCDVCHNDTMGAWIKFYRELDSEWAERLMQYVYYEWKKDK